MSITLRVFRLSPCGRNYSYSTEGSWKMEASLYIYFINAVAHIFHDMFLDILPDSSTISAWYTPFSCFPLCLDKRTDNWLLVYSPVPISCIFLCYLVVIWVGPKLMAKRQPVNLKPVLIVYNFAMVCLSAYMFYEVPLHCMWGHYLPYWCRTRQLFDYYINLRGNSMWVLCLLLVSATPKWPKTK